MALQQATPAEVAELESVVDGHIDRELRTPTARSQSGRTKTAQHSLTSALELRLYVILHGDLGPADQAHLEACTMEGAFEWLRALGDTIPTQLPAYAIRLAARARLRLPVIGLIRTDGPCPRPACQGGVLDAGGRHAFTCKAGGLCIRFHDAISRLLRDWALDAGLSAHLATLADTRPPAGEPHTKVDLVVEAGLLIGAFRTTNLDVSARTLASRLEEPDEFGTDILQKMLSAENAKTAKHLPGTRSLGRLLVPFILHTGGGLAPKALAFTKKLSRAAKGRLPPEPARRFHSDWMQRYSCTVQRMAADTLRHSQHYFTAEGGLVNGSRHGGYVHQVEASRLADPAALRCRCGPALACHCHRDRRPHADFAPPRPPAPPSIVGSPLSSSPIAAPASGLSSPIAAALPLVDAGDASPGHSPLPAATTP
jgi:hypothetical protein